MENKTFSDLISNELLCKQLTALEITNPTPIQTLAIPKIKEGLDVIGQAQTGTGKTFAFGLPLLEKINPKSKDINALILCPTRELANQVNKELTKVIHKSLDIRTATIFGGESFTKQERELRNKPQIIIGTPGRIIDLLNRKKISFSKLETLIFDEADEMLSMGFKDDLETILKTAPKERQTILFSATLPTTIKDMAKNYQKDPVRITVKAETLTVDRITQKVYACLKESKKDLLIRLLDFYRFESTIIFCNTKACVDELVMLLQSNEFKVDGLHGDLKQTSRDRVLDSFRKGVIKILIATDVAARGLDIKNIKGVINYDLPMDDEVYVHRIGRTGRAGTTGTALSIMTPRQRTRINEIARYTKSKMIEEKIPSLKEIQAFNAESNFEKIKTELDKNNDINEDNINLANRLVKEGFEPTQIISVLMDMVYSNSNRQYNEILVQTQRFKDRNNTNNNRGFNKPRGNRDYINVHLNIGKHEDLRPQVLVGYLVKEAKVRKENIGDISIKTSGTTLEVTKQAFNYLIKINGKKYKDKKIVITKM